MGGTRALKKGLVISIHALIGWGICGAIIGIGRNVTSMDTTLIIHLIAVPLVFAVISFIYHGYFRYTPPVVTALIFMGSAMALNTGLVAPVMGAIVRRRRSAAGGAAKP